MSETAEQRSRTMRAVKSADTRPELLVRRAAFALGYRYRLHKKELPGTPDLVFARRRAVIFVNGCFWHAHDCPRGARTPKKNREYWQKKIARNAARDISVRAELKALGWRSLTLWECELKDAARLDQRLRKFLDR